MYNSVELINDNYRCIRCGKILKDVEVNDHAWSKHYKEEISDCMVRLNSYIDEVSSFFVNSRKLNVDHKDVAQFVRIGIYELFQSGKFTPPQELTKSGDSVIDRFAKAACNLFLLKFMREYFYRRNHVHYRNREPLPGFKYSESCFDNSDVYNRFNNTSNDMPTQENDNGQLNYDRLNVLVIKDVNIEDPLSAIYHDQITKIICNHLTEQEIVLFNFITDEEYDYTQPQIAKFMGIKQQTVSMRIKKLRKKIKRILKDNY